MLQRSTCAETKILESQADFQKLPFISRRNMTVELARWQTQAGKATFSDSPPDRFD
jgi:hypothetical protein